jgi:hypothetical protein
MRDRGETAAHFHVDVRPLPLLLAVIGQHRITQRHEAASAIQTDPNAAQRAWLRSRSSPPRLPAPHIAMSTAKLDR